MPANWKSTSTKPPDNIGYLWIRRELTSIELGEYNGTHYRSYGASADREGLGIETYSDVTHWAECEPPEFDFKEND